MRNLRNIQRYAVLLCVVGVAAMCSSPTQAQQPSTCVYLTNPPLLADGFQSQLRCNPNGTVQTGVAPANLYSAAAVNITMANAATDVYCINGSASKTVRVLKTSISSAATVAALASVSFVKRSTANSGGTTTAPTRVPHDSTSPAATATVLSYTANPTTLGTLVGAIGSFKMLIGDLAGGGNTSVSVGEIGGGSQRGIALRGTGESLCINLNAGTFAGNTTNLDFTWVEE